MRDLVLAVWGSTVNGTKVLLHLMMSPRENAEMVSEFF